MIETTESKVTYAITEGTGNVFTFAVPFFTETDIHAYLFSDDSETELVRGTDFAVSYLDGKTDYTEGGTVTVTADLPVGSLLTIAREVPATQNLALAEYGKLPSAPIEKQLDRTIMVCQQLRDTLGRAVLSPRGEEVGDKWGTLVEMAETATEASGRAVSAAEAAEEAVREVTPRYTFGSVADLQASELLGSGQIISAAGYYSPGDGGETTFAIKTTDDGYGIAIGDTGLYANPLFGEDVSVRQFGAKGDGETDDTAAIQAAVTAALALKRGLYLSAGTYLVTDTIRIDDVSNTTNHHRGLRIRGAGQSATILKADFATYSAGTDAEVALYGKSVLRHSRTVGNTFSDGLVIEGITIEGAGRTADVKVNGISIVGAWQAKIQRVYLKYLSGDALLVPYRSDLEDSAGGSGSDPYAPVLAVSYCNVVQCGGWGIRHACGGLAPHVMCASFNQCDAGGVKYTGVSGYLGFGGMSGCGTIAGGCDILLAPSETGTGATGVYYVSHCLFEALELEPPEAVTNGCMIRVDKGSVNTFRHLRCIVRYKSGSLPLISIPQTVIQISYGVCNVFTDLTCRPTYRDDQTPQTFTFASLNGLNTTKNHISLQGVWSVTQGQGQLSNCTLVSGNHPDARNCVLFEGDSSVISAFNVWAPVTGVRVRFQGNTTFKPQANTRTPLPLNSTVNFGNLPLAELTANVQEQDDAAPKSISFIALDGNRISGAVRVSGRAAVTLPAGGGRVTIQLVMQPAQWYGQSPAADGYQAPAIYDYQTFDGNEGENIVHFALSVLATSNLYVWITVTSTTTASIANCTTFWEKF